MPPTKSAMFFGVATALKVETTSTKPKERGGHEIPGAPTVSLYATVEQTNPQGTKYNWDREAVLAIQIGEREITDVMAVLSGYLSKADFRFHGREKNKSYRFERSAQVVNLSLSGPDQQFNFKLAGAERFTLLALCFRQWQRQQGGLSADVLYRMLEAAYR